MRAIVTIYNEPYRILLEPWLKQIRSVSDIPVFVLVLGNAVIDEDLDCKFIRIPEQGNPFPSDLPDHACAEKLRLFEHLPKEVSEILFLDIDVMVLNNFWSDAEYFEKSKKFFIACPDLFVGYKEKMEEEFQPFDPSFHMKYFPDGTYRYFNTGVFFASREAHVGLFSKSLATWKKYVDTTGHYPSIFDQNVFNYCLIASSIPVDPMPIQNNYLRQYEKIIESGKVFSDDKEVNALHFNGGEASIKLSRWLECLQEINKATQGK